MDPVLELDVVRDVAKLLHRRWGLKLHLTHRNAPEVIDGTALCAAAQAHEAGRRACSEHLSSLVAASDGGAIGSSCHLGLRAIAKPIRGDSFLVCAGFTCEGDDSALVGQRARALGIDAELSDGATDVPRLSADDLEFLERLLGRATAAIREGEPTLGEARRGFDQIVGAAPAMQALYRTLARVAPTDSTVLIRGDNGTGKELVARAIHRHSRRGELPFVVQNCSAFNDNLLDSELFGHRRGAFTGAVADKPGLFEVADGGTLFLDEIGDMSPALQVKVLRVLQEGTFTPVGDTVERHVDVRVLAATNRPLKEMVDSGAFREDLYYRINVIELVLPPLRERSEDIPLLAAAFLASHRGDDGPRKELTADALDHLCGYQWPGNVRELQNEIERAVVLTGDREVIDTRDLSERMRSATTTAMPSDDKLEELPLAVALRRLERRMIRAALERHGWNKTRAAAELEISRRNLIRLVHKHELEKSNEG